MEAGINGILPRGVMAANVATAKALQQMAQYVLQATAASPE